MEADRGRDNDSNVNHENGQNDQQYAKQFSVPTSLPSKKLCYRKEIRQVGTGVTVWDWQAPENVYRESLAGSSDST